MKILIVVLIACMLTYIAKAQQYGIIDSARLFGESSISNGDFTFNASFTPDNSAVFFSRSSINFGYIAVFFAVKKGDGWSRPKAVSFTGRYRNTDPFVTADGKHLYFSSDRPLPGKPFKDYDYHLYRVDLVGSHIVSEPVLINLPATATPNYCTFAANGNVYFSATGNGDSEIYRCVYQNDRYLEPERLSFNGPKLIDFDPAIASDESFIVFTSNNRQGIGGSDLWIAFRKKDGQWTEPANLGPKVNTRGTDGAPGLSPDNRTLYFSSSRETISSADRMQPLTTSQILDRLHGVKNGLRNIYAIRIDGLIKQASN